MTTTADLTALGPSYRQIDTWTRNGWLRLVAGGGGSGYERRYAAGEREVVARAWELMGALGAAPERALAFARRGVGCHRLGARVSVVVRGGVGRDAAAAFLCEEAT